MLEWTWFLNSFSKGHLYEFMYGDKDTYGLAFALANKAHMYQHINMPPGKTDTSCLSFSVSMALVGMHSCSY
jgi:hypothetical protein